MSKIKLTSVIHRIGMVYSQKNKFLENYVQTQTHSTEELQPHETRRNEKNL